MEVRQRNRAMRNHCLVGLLWLIVSSVVLLNGYQLCHAEPASDDDARRNAAHRTRRIMLNSDGGDVCQPEAATPEGLLSLRVAPLAGTQLDAILYCSHWGFNHCTHNTAVGEIFEPSPPKVPVSHSRTLINQGRDNLQIMIDFCHDNQMEAWWSMRMNDVHDGKIPEIRPQFKKDYPQWLVGKHLGDKTPDMIGESRWWSAVDYEHDGVRERAFELIEEVCRNYDVEGVELDYFRHPVYFQRHRFGRPASPEQVELMTEFMHRVHAMTVEVGRERGRPLLVAVRVPDTVEVCAHFGFDIPTWAQEKLVDLIIPGGYFYLGEWQEMIELGHAHDIPVYPCLSASRLRKDNGVALEREALLWRGAALNVWEADADGVYTFNYFHVGPQPYRELGDPEMLRQMPRVYAPVLGDVDKFLGGPRGKQLRRRYGHLPRDVTADQPQTARLQVNESLPDAEQVQLTLRLRFNEISERDGIEVAVNGVKIAGLAPSTLTDRTLSSADDQRGLAGSWLECAPDPSVFRPGANEVTVSCTGEGPILFQSVQLEVNPR